MNQNFLALGLEEVIVQAVDQLGFEKPSPVQEKSIPIVLNEDTDLVAFRDLMVIFIYFRIMLYVLNGQR